MKKSACVRLGMQSLLVTMKGKDLTKSELYALQTAAQAALYDAAQNSDVALMRRAALDVVEADPLTDDHINALRSALTAFIAPKREGESPKPEYDWQRRVDLA